jgi:hypothetical protein
MPVLLMPADPDPVADSEAGRPYARVDSRETAATF